MTTKQGAIYGAIIIALSALLWGLHKRDRHLDNKISSPVLLPSESAKVILDTAHHTVVTVTRTGPVRKTYLPPHITSVTIAKDGTVTVTSRSWGTEVSPYIGLGYADKARLYLGADLLYWHRWEAGPFVGLSNGPFSARVGLRVAFNVWNNTSVFVGIDNAKTPTGGISLKF